MITESQLEWSGDHIAHAWYGDDSEVEVLVTETSIQIETGSLTVTVDAGSSIEESKRLAEGWLPHFIKFVTGINEVASKDWRQQLCNQKPDPERLASALASTHPTGFDGNGSEVA